MKRIILIMYACVCVMMFFGCEPKDERDGHKDQEIIDLNGTWKIYNQECDGTVIFDAATEQLDMQLNDGRACHGDFGLVDGQKLSISYAENQDGEEILTDSDYEAGGIICPFYSLGNGSVSMFNLPYYRNCSVVLKR